jgi:acyl CoA:acetate/3-ketoacid CoA transferase alpha subunit
VTDKRMTEADVIGRLQSGMTIGIGGWASRRKPMSLVRAILRSGLTDLTVVAYGGPDVGLLCAAGKVSKLVFGFVSLDSIPLDPHFRAARQQGRLEVTEYDEGMLQLGLYAAGTRIPFLPTRAGLGSLVVDTNPGLRMVVDPYDGEELIAMPAVKLDAALVHMNRADELGNAQFLGPDPYFDDLMCAAAEEAYVSCEQIVPTEELTKAAHPVTVRISRMLVAGVVEAPTSKQPPTRTGGRRSASASWKAAKPTISVRSPACPRGRGPDDARRPFRNMRHSLRGGLPWQRRDPCRPYRRDPGDRRAPGPAHIRAPPAGHRR